MADQQADKDLASALEQAVGQQRAYNVAKILLRRQTQRQVIRTAWWLWDKLNGRLQADVASTPVAPPICLTPQQIEYQQMTAKWAAYEARRGRDPTNRKPR